MQKSILAKIISLALALILLFSLSLCLVACNKGGDDDDDSSDNQNAEGGDENENSKPKEDYHSKVVVPAYKDFERGTVDFKDVSYSRPDFEAVIAKISSVTDVIEENTLTFEEQIRKITELEDDYNNVLTMYAFANIYNSKDSSSKYWNDEYSYITSGYPKFAESIEDMFVAAANSPHAERFEEEYFGDELIEKYKDGGKFTDEMIELWAKEEALESAYSSLSTATVEVTYRNVTDSVDNILAFYRDKYGETSTEYLKAYTVCMGEYDEKVDEKSLEIFMDLIKLRHEIASELGHNSYMDYGYEVLDRDYSKEQLSRFLDDVCEYVVPAYLRLKYFVLTPYFMSNEPSEISLDVLINNGYTVLSEVDSELGNIYHYMLQHGLYDIELSETNRNDGAFTTYLDTYNAPFIFMSASGNVSDYSTLFHEFGHFADGYINYNSQTSIDCKELSSQGLEYLMLLKLGDTLDAKDMQYLTLRQLSNAMETLIYQSFYAKLEELIYELPSDSITEEKLNEQVVIAAEKFGLNTEYVNDISVAFIPHIFLYPFYVQSYAVSVVPALELYFKELENERSGLMSYRIMIERNEVDLSFEEALENAFLTSPFEDGILRTITDKIYYHLSGQHIYSEDKNQTDNLNAA